MKEVRCPECERRRLLFKIEIKCGSCGAMLDVVVKPNNINHDPLEDNIMNAG